eukprot:Rhum_TRINITY_DN14632_c8_g1::Rhum_TRINITY_DN14632_c8_g1_i1::g.106408::m.106408
MRSAQAVVDGLQVRRQRPHRGRGALLEEPVHVEHAGLGGALLHHLDVPPELRARRHPVRRLRQQQRLRRGGQRHVVRVRQRPQRLARTRGGGGLLLSADGDAVQTPGSVAQLVRTRRELRPQHDLCARQTQHTLALLRRHLRLKPPQLPRQTLRRLGRRGRERFRRVLRLVLRPLRLRLLLRIRLMRAVCGGGGGSPRVLLRLLLHGRHREGRRSERRGQRRGAQLVLRLFEDGRAAEQGVHVDGGQRRRVGDGVGRHARSRRQDAGDGRRVGGGGLRLAGLSDPRQRRHRRRHLRRQGRQRDGAVEGVGGGARGAAEAAEVAFLRAAHGCAQGRRRCAGRCRRGRRLVRRGQRGGDGVAVLGVACAPRLPLLRLTLHDGHGGACVVEGTVVVRIAAVGTVNFIGRAHHGRCAVMSNEVQIL